MRYYIFVNQQQIGPMTLEQLRFYNVTGDTLVRDENHAEWKALMYYPDLMAVYGPNAAGGVCPPPPVVVEERKVVYAQPRKSDDRWIIWLVAAIVGIPVLGFVLYILFYVVMMLFVAAASGF